MENDPLEYLRALLHWPYQFKLTYEHRRRCGDPRPSEKRYRILNAGYRGEMRKIDGVVTLLHLEKC